MPLIEKSTYRPVPYLFNGHLETIIPSIFRKIEGTYTRERIELEDGDFLDLDWMAQGSKKLVIISHGLEGSSERHYCKGMAKYFYDRGWDAVSWNCRSCSGEMNRALRMYHHAAIDDVDRVVRHALQKNHYDCVVLAGFSMGGSLSLNYLGAKGKAIPSVITSCVVFSVPCHLGSSAKKLDERGMGFYRRRFLKKLGKKIQQKSRQFPDHVNYEGFEQITTFREFDNRYTAPLHGFIDADDFYDRASAMHGLHQINVPTLIVNARNDPFLPPECFPITLAKDHPCIYLEMPARGGHTGFPLFNQKENWMEQRAFEFVTRLA